MRDSRLQQRSLYYRAWAVWNFLFIYSHFAIASQTRNPGVKLEFSSVILRSTFLWYFAVIEFYLYEQGWERGTFMFQFTGSTLECLRFYCQLLGCRPVLHVLFSLSRLALVHLFLHAVVLLLSLLRSPWCSSTLHDRLSE